MSVFAAAILILCSPVGAKNKPLDDKEKAVFGKISRCITTILQAAYIAVSVLGLVRVSKTVCISMLAVAAFVAAGKISAVDPDRQKANDNAELCSEKSAQNSKQKTSESTL